MSYFVIKGPAGGRHYLCLLPGFATPQWNTRESAKRFPDEESAWRWLQAVATQHGDYTGRPVRVMTQADRRAEAARLRAEIERLRGALVKTEDLLLLRDQAHAAAHGRVVKLEAALVRICEIGEFEDDPDGDQMVDALQDTREVARAALSVSATTDSVCNSQGVKK